MALHKGSKVIFTLVEGCNIVQSLGNTGGIMTKKVKFMCLGGKWSYTSRAPFCLGSISLVKKKIPW
jgi:hypothetical protein